MIITATLIATATAQAGSWQPERLNRGVVATVAGEGKIFVSWRLLGTEPEDTRFDLYRSVAGQAPVKLNDQPLTGGTCFMDEVNARGSITYTVHALKPDGSDAQVSQPYTIDMAHPVPYRSVPIQTPEGYSPNDCSVADLDGDGEYEIILHQVNNPKDNSHSGVTGAPILQAYTLSGKKLWEINLGPNIREGAHYTQFMVYDLDGDGRAELVCKTADGTRDGIGNVIGDPNANYVNEAGYILAGPEFLTVFDGSTGRALATTDYIPPRHPDTLHPTGDQLKDIWGDGYGNRCDRFLACVAYLDGEHPSVVMARGYYTRTVLAAFDWRNGKLTHRWTFDTSSSEQWKNYAGQGNHNLSVADVDGDGKDEIIYGGMVVDDDGKGLFTTQLGHGDAMHVSDLDPTRPGLELYRIQEPFSDAGAHLVDLSTGQIIWKRPSVRRDGKGQGPGRGLAADIDPRYPGAECWSFGAGITGLVNINGDKISENTPNSCNFAIWWDGDDLRELLDKTTITKWDWQSEKVTTLLDAAQYGCRSNNGTKATPAISADLFGDWREEVIWPTEDGTELRVFTTTIPTQRRLPTLMHDRQYRLAIAWQNVGYNQPPWPSFYIGQGMDQFRKKTSR